MFSVLISVHIIKTGKLYFHEMFPLKKKTKPPMMYYNAISEGLTTAAIFLFLIPDQRKGTSNLELTLWIQNLSIMERRKTPLDTKLR